VKSGRPTFEAAVQGVGDILVYAAARKTQQETVTRCFDILATTIRGFLVLKGRSDQAFLGKALNPEYAGRTEQDLGFAMWMMPDETLKGFTLPMEQVRRGFQAATESGNDDVADKAMYWLDETLGSLVVTSGNEQLIRATLRQYDEVLRVAERGGDAYFKSHAASGWFFHVVLAMPSLNGTRFRTEYLDLLSDALFSRMRWMVDEGETDVFVAYCSSVVDSLHQNLSGNDVFELLEVLRKVRPGEHLTQQNVADLESLMFSVKAAETGCVELAEVEDAAVHLRRIYDGVERQMAEEERVAFKGVSRGLLDRLDRLAILNRVDEVTFSVAAYSIASDRQDYVRRLLEYNNPPGATAVSINRDPLPTSPSELLKRYLLCWSGGKRFNRFGSHRNGEGFKRRLAVDLLARAVGPAPTTGGLHLFAFRPDQPHFDSGQASSMGYEAGRMAEAAASMAEGQPDAVIISSGDEGNARESLWNVKSGLEEVQAETGRATEVAAVYEHVSDAKVVEFQKEVYNSFREASGWRDFLAEYPHLYADKSLEGPDDDRGFGVNVFDDKAAFFEKWYVHYIGRGESHGRGLSHEEGRRVVEELLTKCERPDAGSFEAFLEGLPKDARLAALSSPLASLRMSEVPDVFTPHWARPGQRTHPHLEGWLTVHGKDVPLFGIVGWASEDEVMLVDVDRLGEFVQETPLLPADDPEWLVGFIMVAVLELESQEDLFRQTLQDDPEWLVARKSDLSKEDYLRTKVWVRVFERFSLNLGKDFGGWLCRFPPETKQQ